MNLIASVNLFLVLLTLGSPGCGPALQTSTRLEVARAPGNEGRMVREGLVVEVAELRELPQALQLRARLCGPDGKPQRAGDGQARTQLVSLVPPGAEVSQLRLTNQSEHVMRLSGSVFRLFDPGQNPAVPQAEEDLLAAVLTALAHEGVCAGEAERVEQALATIKLLTPRAEILPGASYSGYLIFTPTSPVLPGVWTLALYEVPVRFDDSGAPLQRTRFEFTYLRRQVIDTFSLNPRSGERKIVKTEEVPWPPGQD